MIGRTLSSYEITDKLGVEAMGELAVLDVETGERRVVVEDLPFLRGEPNFAVAPDGTAIYYSGERIESNIWMVERGLSRRPGSQTRAPGTS